MTTDEINKELVLADVILSAIEELENPMLLYGAEKEVVKKALHDYKYKLESELRGR